jgi:hypothetical protein
VTVRVRLWLPVPHDLVHAVHAVKAETAQCTAHGPTEQSTISAGSGQTAPPFWGSVSERERDRTPPPHDFVHAEYESHVPTTQSTGHANVLQSTISVLTGHSLPPNDGAVCVRERDCAPPPHDFVQAL